MRSEMPEVEYATSVRLRQGDQQGIVKTGDKNLALKLEERGYDWIKEEIGEVVSQ